MITNKFAFAFAFYIRRPPIAAAAAAATRRFALIARMATSLDIIGFPLRLRVLRPPIAAAILLFVDFARDTIFAIAALAFGFFLREFFIFLMLRRVRDIYIYSHDKK